MVGAGVGDAVGAIEVGWRSHGGACPEALIMTAFGLFVAVAAVLGYNWLAPDLRGYGRTAGQRGGPG